MRCNNSFLIQTRRLPPLQGDFGALQEQVTLLWLKTKQQWKAKKGGNPVYRYYFSRHFSQNFILHKSIHKKRCSLSTFSAWNTMMCLKCSYFQKNQPQNPKATTNESSFRTVQKGFFFSLKTGIWQHTFPAIFSYRCKELQFLATVRMTTVYKTFSEQTKQNLLLVPPSPFSQYLCGSQMP